MTMGTLGAVLALVTTGNVPVAVHVDGDGACPSPSSVERALVGMGLSPRGAAPAFELAVDARDPNVLAVDVRAVGADGVGRSLASRQFGETMSCAERAETAAVLAATTIAGATVDAPTPDRPASVEPPLVRVVADPAPPEPAGDATDRAWTVGLSTLGLLAWGQASVASSGPIPTVGFAADVSAWLWQDVALRGEVVWTGERAVSFPNISGSHSATWQRGAAGLGLRGRLPRWRRLVGDVGGLLAYTVTKGEGFNRGNLQKSSVIPGVDAAVGLEWPVGPQGLVALEVGTLVWLARETVMGTVDGVSVDGRTLFETVGLPRAELTLRLRGSFGFGDRRR